MSLRAIREALSLASARREFGDTEEEAQALEAARAEIAALEKAAKDLARLRLGDGVDDVAHRSHVPVAAVTHDPKSQWYHPDVTAWAEAAQLLEAIAKEAE